MFVNQYEGLVQNCCNYLILYNKLLVHSFALSLCYYTNTLEMLVSAFTYIITYTNISPQVL